MDHSIGLIQSLRLVSGLIRSDLRSDILLPGLNSILPTLVSISTFPARIYVLLYGQFCSIMRIDHTGALIE